MNFAALTTTHAVDTVYTYIFRFCLVLLVGITAVMIYFVVRYHHKTHPQPEPSPDSNFWLELTWFVVPTLIALSMFWVGWKGFATLVDVPPKAMEVHVTGRQWVWSFRYANGKTSDKLYVPVNRPIKLEITSLDVVHSFFVPAFRIKKDAVPGMTTVEWFRAPKEGSYDAYCTQYCGLGHSRMLTKVVAMAPDKFQDWYRQKAPAEEAASGKALLQKYGCTGCHSLDGSKGVGPTLKGIFGRSVTVLTAGKERSLTVDEAYIKRSILRPKVDVVKGFVPVMPSFEGKISAHDLEEIVEFLKKGGVEEKSAAKVPEGAAAGKSLANKKGCTACHSADGSKGVGPTWKGLFGSQVTVTTNGKERTLKADAAYIRRSIHDPGADVVKGFSPIMPSFADLSKKDLDALVDYIESLK